MDVCPQGFFGVIRVMCSLALALAARAKSYFRNVNSATTLPDLPNTLRVFHNLAGQDRLHDVIVAVV